MKLVKRHIIDGKEVHIYNDRGHFIVYVNGDFEGSADNEQELKEILDAIE